MRGAGSVRLSTVAALGACPEIDLLSNNYLFNARVPPSLKKAPTGKLHEVGGGYGVVIVCWNLRNAGSTMTVASGKECPVVVT